MHIFERLNQVAKDAGLTYLVIGGNAVNAYGFSRLTDDWDILINRNEKGKWLEGLQKHGCEIRNDAGTFVQLTIAGAEPLDCMMVATETFVPMKAQGKDVVIDGQPVRVPSLEHLLALKFHALKHGPLHRNSKDFLDVLTLVDENGIDVRSDKFRELCDKYGNAKLYEHIVAFKGE